MYRIALAVTALALGACAAPVPDSGAGVGFEDYADYNSYRAQRDAELQGAAPATVLPPVAPVNSAPRDEPVEVAALPATTAPEPTIAAGTNSPTISDEQDFGAVSDRQSIESDAERLAAQREAYQVIEPTALPSRPGSGGPNIVQYAISTTNAVGQPIYRRSALSTAARYQRNCAKYPSPDLAQEAFMRAGGPERDRMGIDPDGDGFACAWDPAPFRRVSTSSG